MGINRGDQVLYSNAANSLSQNRETCYTHEKQLGIFPSAKRRMMQCSLFGISTSTPTAHTLFLRSYRFDGEKESNAAQNRLRSYKMC